MTYSIAEKFKSLQGEGVYSGTPMAFIRTVGCSVGKTICQHCDTDFDRTLPWQGGGVFTADQLDEWVGDYSHVCLTGGEPLDTVDENLVRVLSERSMVHIETSGTRPLPEYVKELQFHGFVWVCVSPKPGFLEEVITRADEIKVIVPGLGTPESLDRIRLAGTHEHSSSPNLRWPSIEDAKRWAQRGTPVFLQPRNGKKDIDPFYLTLVQDTLREQPQLRLSVQLHKILKVQ